MSNKLKYRGHDYQEYNIFPESSLGYIRSSIIDLSLTDNHPMSKFRYTIVYNGKIYNYIKLKSELNKKEYKHKGTKININ